LSELAFYRLINTGTLDIANLIISNFKPLFDFAGFFFDFQLITLINLQLDVDDNFLYRSLVAS
jgi:hypothetical protein